MKWQRARATELRVCGSCRARFAAAAPMLLVTVEDLVRCAACAQRMFGVEPPSVWPEDPPAPSVPPKVPEFVTPKKWATAFDPKLAQLPEEQR